MTGESWRLVDSHGIVFYVDDPVGPDRENFLRQVISSGTGWSPNYQQRNLENYDTLEGNYDPAYASRPLDISLSGRALHVRGGLRANIVSYTDTDSTSSGLSRSSSITCASTAMATSPTAWSSGDETLVSPVGSIKHDWWGNILEVFRHVD
ncbi:hypothetical protein GGR58DRAFT_502183 [Xylaria digitata]|nr:hypothetical protein GGR58DRAFT_502183 [Xylaria digitata]